VQQQPLIGAILELVRAYIDWMDGYIRKEDDGSLSAVLSDLADNLK